MKLRAPAVPLITVDPYFSIWAPDTTLNVARTMHWTGKNNQLLGTVTVDGKEYAFLGYHRNFLKLDQVSLDIDALSTTAVFRNDAISLKVVFSTPLLPDDYRLLTRPVSYMEVTYTALDGKQHDVSVKVMATEELCLDRPGQSPIEAKEVSVGEVSGISIGNTEQKPLNRSGDDLRIDWGYFYLMTNLKNAARNVLPNYYHKQTYISVSGAMTENAPAMYYFAYDDCGKSIEYFGKHLTSYWNKDGQTILEAIREAADDYEANLPRCRAFSEKLWNDALASGGEQYAEMLSLAYRQVIAAHKLAVDENGEILYISKECFSNGCAATVDVSYPSIPMFLLYNPELVKGMMRPIYRYALSNVWKKEYKYDFAPHDVGQYPILNGQVYGYHRSTGVMDYDKQMPVEECGNMLIMEANVAIATGSADFAASHLKVLEQWCDYLIRYGVDPENQLCTDDFAGHLAHNCNLSLKAIMGLRGMAIIMKMLGKVKKAAYYKREAKRITEIWMQTAVNEDGTTRLAFDRPDSFSMKYNMVWDKVWGTRIFTQKFMDAELADNKKHFNTYGMPLDNRAEYTKSDWLVWTASMASKKSTFMAFIAPLWKAYNESPSRVPMTDWYDTKSGRIVSFQHRTVQGGLFMRVLMDAWKTREI
jgi:hypothetical protein